MTEGTAEPVPGTPTRTSRVLFFALVVALLGAIGSVLWLWWRVLGYPYPLDYGEGPLLSHARQLADGRPVYLIPGAESPWTIVNYPPVYPLANAAVSVLAGPAYWYGRLISMVGAVLSAVFAGLIVGRVTRDRSAALVTALLMPVIPYLGAWAALARVDALALGLSLAGLWCVVRQPTSNRWLIAAVVLLTAAAYTRQTYLLVAPVAAFCWLWPDGRRRALGFAAALAGSVLVLGLALNLATAGGFWFNVVTANVNAFDWTLLTAYLTDIGSHVPVLVLLLVAGGIVGIRRQQQSTRLLIPYALSALVIVLTSGKEGSNVNYLLEFGTALCLASGLLLAAVRSSPRARTAVLVALLLQSLLLLVAPHGYYGYLGSLVDNRAVPARISAVVTASGGPILADEDAGFLPINGDPIVLQTFEFRQLALAGVWDQTPLLTSIENRTYPLIMIYTNGRSPSVLEQRWTPEMLTAIHANYRQTEVIDRGGRRKTLIYEPRR